MYYNHVVHATVDSMANYQARTLAPPSCYGTIRSWCIATSLPFAGRESFIIMFLVIQIPLVDLRQFIADDLGLLGRPNWPAPIANRDFVRSFGSIRRRPRGGLPGWLGESLICEANRAVRLRGILHSRDKRVDIKLFVCFKRFYFDGLAVGKFEIGIVLPDFPRLIANDQKAFLQSVLSTHATVPTAGGGFKTCRIVDLGKPLANLYATSSRRTSWQGNHQNWWVQPCEPMLLVEPKQHQGLLLPFQGKVIPLRDHLRDFILSCYTVPDNGGSLRMWMLAPQKRSLRWWSSKDPEQFQQQRAIRMYLLRLHAERECLNRVLSELGTGRLEVEPRSSSADMLQHYLNIATRRISRREKNLEKLAEDGVAEAVRSAEDYLAPGERDSILAALDNLDTRKNVFRKVERYLSGQVNIKELVMGDKITVGQAAVVGRGGTAQNVNFSQIWHQVESKVNQSLLAEELAQLRLAMEAQANTPEQYAAVKEIALAEEASRSGKGPAVLEHLTRAGKWTFDVGTKVGIGVAVAALKSALGM